MTGDLKENHLNEPMAPKGGLKGLSREGLLTQQDRVHKRTQLDVAGMMHVGRKAGQAGDCGMEQRPARQWPWIPRQRNLES